MKFLFLVLLVTSCTSFISGRRELVLKRAAFDLNCSQSELKIVDLGDYAFGVTGCGRRSSYVVDCPKNTGHTSSSCVAILNTKAKNR